jgi:hypothetical protein
VNNYETFQINNPAGILSPVFQEMVHDSVKNHPVFTAHGLVRVMLEGLTAGDAATFGCFQRGLPKGYALMVHGVDVYPLPQLAMLYNPTHEHAVRDALLSAVRTWAQQEHYNEIVTTIFNPKQQRSVERLAQRVFPAAKVVGHVFSFKVNATDSKGE